MHEKDNVESLTEELLAELEKADTPGSLITASVDRSIANLARQQFSSRPDKRRIAVPAWLGIAATVLLAVFVLPLIGRLNTGTDQLYTDVNKSGQIDIADVLDLARHQDGKTSQAELDAFAMRIVSLTNTGDES